MTKKPFYVHCKDCQHEWAAAFLPIPLNVMAKLLKCQCPMCGSKRVLLGEVPKPTEEGQAHAWLDNGDTGISSKTIWGALMKSSFDYEDVPHDPADFGRCYRLLKVMPEWRARLPEVAALHPEWKPFVDAWDELTTLYEAELPNGTAPKLYQRMQELRGDR